MSWEKLRAVALHLLWPQVCVSCKIDLPRDARDPLCRDCLPRLVRLDPPYCTFCANVSCSGAPCRGCLKRRPSCRVIRAACLYREPAASLIYAFKYRGLKSAARWSGTRMAQAMENLPELGKPDVLVPVPLHQHRLAQRGYNQADLLAWEISKAAAIPVADLGLIRVKNTRPQWTLGKTARRENLRGAFLAPKGAAQGLSVLLVDDLCTSGTSFEGCAQALLKAGAKDVCAYAFAREI
ncbi:MAG: ComF family protein [Elusimicrobiota bacterium]